MELHEALADIATIRRRLAAVERFHGYRAWTVAIGGLLALAGAVVQPWVVPVPSEMLGRYLAFWIGIALISSALEAVDVIRNTLGQDSLRIAVTRLVFDQFTPCLVAGMLLTCVVVTCATGVGWMLPGLWAVLFSLGVFASCPLLGCAKAAYCVAIWYLTAGTICLSLGPDRAGLAPWTMGTMFGLGQLALAAVFAWEERREVLDAR